jgi:hypothetical protein
MTTTKQIFWAFGFGFPLSLLPSCFGHASGELLYGEPVVYVELPPERIEVYPSAEFHGASCVLR